MLDAGYSAGHIASCTGHSISTVSRLHSKHQPHLSKAIGGCPSKLSPAYVRHAQHLLCSGKADTAVDVNRILSDVTMQSVCDNTVCCALKKAGMKAVVKKKTPFLSKKHRKERMVFGLAHQDWTVEDWQKMVWSYGLMRPKSTGWVQMEGSGLEKARGGLE